MIAHSTQQDPAMSAIRRILYASRTDSSMVALISMTMHPSQNGRAESHGDIAGDMLVASQWKSRTASEATRCDSRRATARHSV